MGQKRDFPHSEDSWPNTMRWSRDAYQIGPTARDLGQANPSELATWKLVCCPGRPWPTDRDRC